MKKILFVINTLGRGGAEAALIQLIKRFDPDEYRIDLYVILSQGELIERIPGNVVLLNKNYDNSSVLSGEGKKALKKKIIKLLFSNASIIKNFFYIAGNGIKMVFSGKVLPDKLLWKALSDGSETFDDEYDLAVAYIEGASAYYVADYVKARKKAAFIHVNYSEAGYNRKLDKNKYLNFDKIFTVSEDVKESFMKVYPECADRTDVFENIIDRDEIINKANDGIGFEDDYNGKRIVTVGRLTAQKAIDVSVEACRKLIEKGENIRWYVLGEGELRGTLEALIDKYGLKDSFILTGVKDNPYPYIKQCDIYVHASRYEGKSIAIREAMILGRPIIVSDCKSNLEQVSNDDALVTTLDPDDLSGKIMTLLHDEKLCEKLGSNAEKRYLDINDDTYKLLKLI